jgi:hypothetical protein
MRKIDFNEMFSGKPKFPTDKPVNNIFILNDRSGSMTHLYTKVTDETNTKIRELTELDKTSGQVTQLQIADFSNQTQMSDNVWHFPVDTATYKPKLYGSGTALELSTVVAIQRLLSAPKISSNPDVANLLLIMTDGEESYGHNREELRRSICNLPPNFTITIIGPVGVIIRWADLVGIPPGNVITWDGRTAESYGQTMSVQSVGLGNYVKTRSAGGSSMQNFYTVNPDKVLPQEFEKLNLIPTTEYSMLQSSLPKVELKPMIESAGFQFKKGVNYYELIKPEKIQMDKDILVFDESKNELRGKGGNGAEVRQFLGIPLDKPILVHPQKGTNNKKIFVQSNSNNRKVISWKDKTTGKMIAQRVIVLK